MEITLTLSNIADMIIIFCFCCIVGYGLGTLLGRLVWLIVCLVRRKLASRKSRKDKEAQKE